MSTELAKAYVQIIPSAKGIQGAITQALSGEATSAGTKTGERFGQQMVGKIKTILAAAGIGKALSASITEGGALQQSLGGIETLFKDQADTVKGFADEAFRTAGLSANQYMETATGFAASLLQSLSGDTRQAAALTQTAITDMSDNANKMGTDMGLIQNAYQGFAKQNYDMLDNLKLGYGGTATEMARLINDSGVLGDRLIDLSDTKEIGKALQEVGFAKMIEAIHVIQEEMGITGTTALEAATTYEGSLASMQAAAKNVLGKLSLGDDISPSLQALADTTKTFLVGNLLPMVGNVFRGLPEILDFGAEIGKKLVAAGPTLLQSGVDAATRLMEGLTQGLGQRVTDFVGQALPMLMAFSGQLRANAGQLVDAGLNLILELGNGLIAALPTLIQTIPTIVSNIAGIINDNAPKLLMTAGTLLWNLAAGLIQNLPLIAQEVPKIIGAIADVILAFNWLNLGKSILTWIRDGVKQLPTILKDLAQKAVEGIKNAFKNGGISKIVSTVLSSIKTLFTSGFSFVKNTVSSAINGVKSLLSGGLNGAKSTVSSALSSIGSKFSSIFSGARSTVSNAISGIKSLISSGLKSASSTVSSILNAIKSKFSSIFSSVRSVVSSAISKIKSMMKFSWSLPKLKLPHFSISGKFSLNPPSVPKLSIKWYRDAMDNPMLLTRPTIFGASGSSLLGAGEAGPEVVSGANTLMDMMRTAVDDTLAEELAQVNDNLERLLSLLLQYFPQLATAGVYLDGEKLVGQMAPGMDRALGRLAQQRGRGR